MLGFANMFRTSQKGGGGYLNIENQKNIPLFHQNYRGVIFEWFKISNTDVLCDIFMILEEFETTFIKNKVNTNCGCINIQKLK